MHLDGAIIDSHEIFADQQSQTDSIIVYLCCSDKLAELLEKFGHFFFFNPFASVDDLGFKHLVRVIIRHENAYFASTCEFDCILDEIDEDLLESEFITD